MQLREIMTKNVITIRGDETIGEAANRMRYANVGCLVVTNEGAVLGIITDRDLVVNCLSQLDDLAERQVGAHMTSPAITADADTDILDAAHQMTENGIRRLPVVEADQLVGLVSFSDIARAMDRPMHDVLAGVGAVRAR